MKLEIQFWHCKTKLKKQKNSPSGVYWHCRRTWPLSIWKWPHISRVPHLDPTSALIWGAKQAARNLQVHARQHDQPEPGLWLSSGQGRGTVLACGQLLCTSRDTCVCWIKFLSTILQDSWFSVICQEPSRLPGHAFADQSYSYGTIWKAAGHTITYPFLIGIFCLVFSVLRNALKMSWTLRELRYPSGKQRDCTRR